MGVCVCKYVLEGPCHHMQDRQKLKYVSVGVRESESCSEGEGNTSARTGAYNLQCVINHCRVCG